MKLAIKSYLLTAITLLLILGLVSYFSFFQPSKEDEHYMGLSATVLKPPAPIANFSLTDNHDQSFTNSNLQNHWSLVFFGFTNCPDICPTTMAQLTELYTHIELTDKKFLPQVILISVDPQRDDIEVLNNYIVSFNKNFIGLTGDPSQIAQVAKNLNVIYQKTIYPQGYSIDHSGAILLIDPQGMLHAIFTPPLDTKQMTHDLVNIQRAYD